MNGPRARVVARVVVCEAKCDEVGAATRGLCTDVRAAEAECHLVGLKSKKQRRVIIWVSPATNTL